MERLGHPEKDKSKRCISSVAENEFSPNSDPTKKGKDFKSSLSNSRMVLRNEEKRKTSSSRTSSKMTEGHKHLPSVKEIALFKTEADKTLDSTIKRIKTSRDGSESFSKESEASRQVIDLEKTSRDASESFPEGSNLEKTSRDVSKLSSKESEGS
jgi:hypothetical protein